MCLCDMSSHAEQQLRGQHIVFELTTSPDIELELDTSPDIELEELDTSPGLDIYLEWAEDAADSG